MDAPFSACHARIGKKKMGVAGDFAFQCWVQIPPRPLLALPMHSSALKSTRQVWINIDAVIWMFNCSERRKTHRNHN
jgi:hypothetical protein